MITKIISESEAEHLRTEGEGDRIEYTSHGRATIQVEPLSYAGEVHTASCQPGVWTSNGLRWPLTEKGKKAAEAYIQDLMWRWTAVEETRVVESGDVPNKK